MDISKEDLLKLTPAQWEARFAKQRREHIAKNGPSASPILDQLAIHGSTSLPKSNVKTIKKIHPLAWAGIGVGSFLLALGGLGFALMLADPKYAAERAAQETKTAQAAEAQAAQQAEEAAAQKAASDAMQQKANLENSVQSDCYQYLRAGLYKKGSLDIQPSWINGDVNSDFVVIQPFSAENGFGQRLSGTAVCSGSQGVVTNREVDMR